MHGDSKGTEDVANIQVFFFNASKWQWHNLFSKI